MIEQIILFFCFAFSFNFLNAVESSSANAEVQVVHEKSKWTYTIINKGKLPIISFYLSVEAPFKVSNTPKGWRVANTDGCSQVSWASTGTNPKSINATDLAPGSKLDGFQITSKFTESTSTQFHIGTWDPKKQEMGEDVQGQVQSPNSPNGNCAKD